MKTLMSILYVTLNLITCAKGNQYEEAMSDAVEKLNQSGNIHEFQDAANTFERISLNEPTKWLPLYYAAYSYIVISYQEQEMSKKDPYLDKAQGFLDKAFKVAPEESELYALQAFLYPSRMIIDPMTRGMEYIGKLNQALDKAIQLNPENPRSYYLRGIILLNMPEAMGGGAAVAKPLFQKAKEKYENFVPESPLSPNWGKEQNDAELNKL